MNDPTPSFGPPDVAKLSDEDAAIALLERAVTGLWEVVNELTRLRRTTRQNYRVTIFGSALSLAWQLLQVRKLYNTPLILVGKMWTDLVGWGRRRMLIKGSELGSDVDFAIPHCVNTIDETIALIRENRAAWLATQQAKQLHPQN
jgi:hypothetical protein